MSAHSGVEVKVAGDSDALIESAVPSSAFSASGGEVLGAPRKHPGCRRQRISWCT